MLTSWSVSVIYGDWRAVANHHIVFLTCRLHPAGAAGVLGNAAHSCKTPEPGQMKLARGSVEQVQGLGLYGILQVIGAFLDNFTTFLIRI